MFLVTPDRSHGLMAAPRSPEDLTPGTEETLTAQGFTWNNDIEAYTCPTGRSPEDVDRTAGALRALGHFVLSSYTPSPSADLSTRAGHSPALPSDQGDHP
ncbi:hypothetical protein [Streptomyces sp. HO565]|uniref:hypothetical protein n=1 Tax=Streptomyces sp. HO565 TaxID=2857489 RepID=UPI0034DB9D70